MFLKEISYAVLCSVYMIKNLNIVKYFLQTKMAKLQFHQKSLQYTDSLTNKYVLFYTLRRI